jgi:hypothetical protein
MAWVSVPYYVVKQRRNGERKGYWQPTKAMIALGARLVPCGADGPEAWAIAAKASAEWRAGKRKDTASRGPRFREGTIAAAFAEYRATEAWTDKRPRTREDWLRGWKYIEPAFGDVRPSLVTMAQLSKFRSIIATKKSTREAHRVIKIWRALWNVMGALKYCNEKDPSLGFQNHAAQARQVFWEFDEVRRLCRRAWEEGYYGLAAVIAVAWDTSMSPVDVRCLRPKDRQGDAFILKRAKKARISSARSPAAQNAFSRAISPSSASRSRQARRSSETAQAHPIRRTRSAAISATSEPWRLVRARRVRSQTCAARVRWRLSAAAQQRRRSARSSAMRSRRASLSMTLMAQRTSKWFAKSMRHGGALEQTSGPFHEQKLDVSNFSPARCHTISGGSVI